MSSPGISLAVRPAIIPSMRVMVNAHGIAGEGLETVLAGSSVVRMRAIVAESADRLTWQEVPDVTPAAGEVLVEVSAAGVNRADLLQAAGNYPPPPGASEILGLEVSGTDRRGRRRRHRLVDRATGLRFAGRRWLRRVRGGSGRPGDAAARRCRPAHAAGLPEVACTVWSNLVMTAGLTAGQLVLVHGGASGIGTHAIQVARALGCRVAVTAGSARQARPVRRTRRRDHDQLPRRGLRRAGRAADGRAPT